MIRDSARIFDEYLVASAIAGDREALSHLIVRWQPKLLRHARRVVGNIETAKDLVQESWVEILPGLARLDDVAAFPAWAFRILNRRCQRQFTAFRPVDLDDALASASDVEAMTQPSSAMEDGAELALVSVAVATLPREQRTTLELFYVECLSVAEIAIAMDVPPGTVKTRLMHARRKVRALLEGDHHGQD